MCHDSESCQRFLKKLNLHGFKLLKPELDRKSQLWARRQWKYEHRQSVERLKSARANRLFPPIPCVNDRTA